MDVKYISNRNKKFMPKPRARFAREWEVMANLDHFAKLNKLPNESLGCFDSIPIFFGFFYLCGGLSMLLLVFSSLQETSFADFEDLWVMLMALIIGLILFYGGYYILEQIVFMKKHPKGFTLHTNLMLRGIKTNGTVIEVKKQKGKTIIRYNFIAHDGELLQSYYLTSSKKVFDVGDQVAILYILNYINILL